MRAKAAESMSRVYGDPAEDVTADIDAPSIDQQASEELQRLPNAFEARLRDQRKKVADIGDSEFWTTIVFDSREQRDAFLTHFGVLDLGDKFVDGVLLAERIGVKLPPTVPIPSTIRVSSRLADLSAPLPKSRKR